MFLESVSTMTQAQKKDFSTPSFERVFDFCQKNIIQINPQMLNIIRNMLDTQVLLQTINKIKLSQ